MADDISPAAARQIADAVAKALAAYGRGLPVPGSPPLLAISEADVRRIVHEGNDRLYDRFRDDQEKLFRRLRMPIDEEHINETSDALGDLFDLNKTIKDATKSWWTGLAQSVLKWLTGGGLLAALYAFMSNGGGKGH